MISADAIRGYIDLIVLSLLKRQPSYAYDLAKTITEVSNGEYTIKQTTLYTALKRLESTGLAASYSGVSDSGKSRTYYRLTSEGTTHLTAKVAEWEDTSPPVAPSAKGPPLGPPPGLPSKTCAPPPPPRLA